jgi:hypothetical protein
MHLIGKPVCYIGIDDTIIANIWPGSDFDLRTNVMTRLRVLSRLFRCRWLTYWQSNQIFPLMKLLYGASTNRETQWTEWQPFGDKVDTVLKGDHNFWWLEDALAADELAKLEAAGLADRYVRVEPEGAKGFSDACLILFERAGIGFAELSRINAKMEWFP